jgi:hypothetical protein
VYVPPPRRATPDPGPEQQLHSSPFAAAPAKQQQAQELPGTPGESRPGTPFREFYHHLLGDKTPRAHVRVFMT